MTSALAKVGLTENPASAVFRSLETVLSNGQQERSYAYRQPSKFLPYVDAKSTRALQEHSQKDCLKAELTIWMFEHSENQILIEGIFCRTETPGAYEWSAKTFSVHGHL